MRYDPLSVLRRSIHVWCVYACTGPSAEMPDLAVILNAHPDTLHERIRIRGAHSRWEREPGARIAEHRLYQQAANLLTEQGVPVLALDCTTTAPEIIAGTVAVKITELHTAKRETTS
ncbi:MAG: hypothetical protein HOV94_43415 [Saccharothrix sp.]|nr:hypothetical protein [Saccharothrix sp.]